MITKPDTAPTTSGVAWKLANRLLGAGFGTGPLATLRRLDPSAAVVADATLHRVLAECVPDAWTGDKDGLRDWTLITHVIALGVSAGLRQDVPLGRALQAAGYKESRLLRLLEAGRETLDVLLPRACRFLVAAGQPLNPAAIGRLVRATRLGGDPLHEARAAIARDFFRAERDEMRKAPSPPVEATP
jgi:hypothetical protein